MADEDFKYLPRITASYKILHDKASDFVRNSKYSGYQKGVTSMVYKLYDELQITNHLLRVLLRQEQESILIHILRTNN